MGGFQYNWPKIIAKNIQKLIETGNKVQAQGTARSQQRVATLEIRLKVPVCANSIDVLFVRFCVVKFFLWAHSLFELRFEKTAGVTGPMG